MAVYAKTVAKIYMFFIRCVLNSGAILQVLKRNIFVALIHNFAILARAFEIYFAESVTLQFYV